MSKDVSIVHRAAMTVRSMLVFGIGALFTAGCASGRTARSYLPVGAGAQYGASTNDGVTWTVAQPMEQAIDSVTTVLQAEGYRLADGSASTRDLLTLPRVVGGDTALVVRAQFLAVALPSPGTSIVLTATYSVPSQKIRDAPVIQRANTTNPLYTRLLVVAATARGLSAR